MKMSGVMVFLIVFLVLLGITLGFPNMPPANILSDLIGIPETITNILGLPGETLVNGIINGAVWGVLITMIYELSRRASKDVIVMPVRAPSPTPMPAPARTYYRPPPKVKHRTSYVSLSNDIETIEGIGPIYGSRLRDCGINDVGDLLRVGSTWKGRRDLAIEVGVSTKKIFQWVNQADFSRIQGIGKQYADLLNAAGVNTIMDLARRNPKNLYWKIRETNMKRNLVKRTPPYSMIDDWIQSANQLTRIVE